MQSLCGVRVASLRAHEAGPLLGDTCIKSAYVLYVQAVKACGYPQGLQAGDVLVRVNGQDVRGRFETLMGQVRCCEGPVVVDVVRYGKPLQVVSPVILVEGFYGPQRYETKDAVVFKATPYLAFEYGVDAGTYLVARKGCLGHINKLTFINGKVFGGTEALERRMASGELLHLIGRSSFADTVEFIR